MDAERRAEARGDDPLRPGRGRGAGLRAAGASAGYFTPEPAGTAEENYSIAIPPPNVTGSLHMGHGAQQHDPGHARPQAPDDGPPGEVDHRHRPRRDRDPVGGREGAARPRGSTATSSAARASSSGSGSGASSTAGRSSSSSSGSAPPATSPTSASPSTTATSRAVYRVFVALYEKGLIYRDNYMVNWDPGSHSAISDLEVENREVEDTLYSIDYPIEGSDRVLTVATVRPETMLADTAVAVNPGRRALRRPRRRRTASCRWSAAGCRSSPTSTSTSSSAPARSRSPRATTRTTSRSAASTASRRSR